MSTWVSSTWSVLTAIRSITWWPCGGCRPTVACPRSCRTTLSPTDQLRAVAKTMAAFHTTATRGPHIDAAATPAVVRDLWSRNFAEMAEFVPSILDPHLLDADQGAGLQLPRRAVVDCSTSGSNEVGSSTGKVISWPATSSACPTDRGSSTASSSTTPCGTATCCSTSASWRWTSTASAGRTWLGVLLDAYREFTAESHPQSLEHHYIAYRALVRSKVACLLAMDGHPEASAEARSLLELSARHLRQGRVQLVLVGGTPGTGKSTVADLIGRRLGWTVLRSDEVRKEEAGIAALDRARAPFESGIYDPASTAATYAELLRRAEIAIAHGESVVLDATWGSEAHRVRAREVAGAGHAQSSPSCAATAPPV